MDRYKQKFQYVWKIPRLLDRSQIEHSPGFSAEENDSVTWFFRFHVPSYSYNMKDTLSVRLVAMRTGKINHHSMYVATVTMHLYSTSILHNNSIFDEKKLTLGMNYQHTNLNDEICTFILKEFDIGSISFWLKYNNSNFYVKCEIYFHEMNHFVLAPKSIPAAGILSLPYKLNTISNPLEDFGKLYLRKEHSDFTIYINHNGKQSHYPAHKIVLAVRSKVFEAMFRHEMRENNLNYVVVEDIREDVFLEVLRYIYTGQVIDQNLNSMVYELLPAADRYDLEKLKIACGNVLRGKLSVQTVLKILTLADMHNVNDLKSDAVQFIKNHSAALARTMDSKVWSDLMARPCLMKDLLSAYMNN